MYLTCDSVEGEGVPQDDFGYGDNEDIYDIADDDPPGN